MITLSLSIIYLEVDNIPESLKILAGDFLLPALQFTVINEVRELSEAFLHEQLSLTWSNTVNLLSDLHLYSRNM